MHPQNVHHMFDFTYQKTTFQILDKANRKIAAIEAKIAERRTRIAKTMDEYCDRLGQGRLPVVRGLALSRDDLVRRAVIMALMCQGELQFESIELAHLIDFRSYFATELETLQTLQEQGLATVHSTGITVTEQGWFFIRAVAMVFDRYLQADRNRARFSRII